MLVSPKLKQLQLILQYEKIFWDRADQQKTKSGEMYYPDNG